MAGPQGSPARLRVLVPPVTRNAVTAQLRGKVSGFPKRSFKKANLLQVTLLFQDPLSKMFQWS